ncbi:hypothetical protein [Haloarcula litorea]|uniref:hypothetical protein n=1 Tax=Haloarcula litorea TaxID=3032579 RepID=UPI0023E87386|nr:hypothetical protein [Halomicroarcula sp. GDY20]
MFDRVPQEVRRRLSEAVRSARSVVDVVTVSVPSRANRVPTPLAQIGRDRLERVGLAALSGALLVLRC